MSNSLQLQGWQPTRLLCLWDFSGKNTGVGCHFLLQEIFPTQELNLHLLHWQVDSLPLSHLGGPKIEQVYLHGKWYVYLKYKFKWAYCIFIYHSHTLVVGDSWEGLEISSLITTGVIFATSV